ncbi:uncharacterized protein LY89DRAFT_741875 [Mollisia scopiformis]|uniref:Uncharacterized protein n=1 Tax=Mollisia scopiformis TaxID=149040 RepID=A0A132B7Z5_MOLSC|nr:uncharacterized protein LY89DRAFT_741875 [Mollisia scopiformis]KUJ08515.1 hypothetical protein LY89DRAFT_741875 [Mollisia scopiformis]
MSLLPNISQRYFDAFYRSYAPWESKAANTKPSTSSRPFFRDNDDEWVRWSDIKPLIQKPATPDPDREVMKNLMDVVDEDDWVIVAKKDTELSMSISDYILVSKQVLSKLPELVVGGGKSGQKDRDEWIELLKRQAQNEIEARKPMPEKKGDLESRIGCRV